MPNITSTTKKIKPKHETLTQNKKNICLYFLKPKNIESSEFIQGKQKKNGLPVVLLLILPTLHAWRSFGVDRSKELLVPQKIGRWKLPEIH